MMHTICARRREAHKIPRDFKKEQALKLKLTGPDSSVRPTRSQWADGSTRARLDMTLPRHLASCSRTPCSTLFCRPLFCRPRGPKSLLSDKVITGGRRAKTKK